MTEITAEIIEAIGNAETVLVCGHIRPDGDCIGSASAMKRLCEKLGKKADAVCDAEPPAAFGFLPQYDEFGILRYEKYDLFIAVDCANEARLGVYRAQLQAAKNSINIDHHPTNGKYCKINHIDPDACSTCYILFKLFSAESIMDRDIATMLYTGLSTDTGHFMHSNTTSAVFNAAAEMCDMGVDIAYVNHEIYCNKSFERIKLTARALEAIRLHADGRIALMTVMQSDLADTGCKAEDTEGLIDNASAVTGVKIAIAMCEQHGGYFRVSLRSVSADVAAVAERFGGGGHRLAAGCIIQGNRFDVADKLLAACAAALGVGN